MNRVGHYWGDTLEDVISYPYQFAYGNHNFKDAVSYYNSGVWDNSIEQAAMDQCLVIAVAIYRGFDKDFTGGALYFNSFKNPDDWRYADDFTLLEVEGTEGFWFYK